MMHKKTPAFTPAFSYGYGGGLGGRKFKALEAVLADVITYLSIVGEATCVRHEYAWLAWNVAT